MFEFNYGNGWSIGPFHWFRGVVRQPNESSSNQNNIYKSLDYFLSFFFGGGGSSLKLKKKWLLANLRVFIFKRQSKYNPNQYFDQISNCSRNNCQFNQRTKHIRIFGLTKTQFPFETNVGHLPPPPSQKNSPFWVFFLCFRAIFGFLFFWSTDSRSFFFFWPSEEEEVRARAADNNQRTIRNFLFPGGRWAKRCRVPPTGSQMEKQTVFQPFFFVFFVLLSFHLLFLKKMEPSYLS